MEKKKVESNYLSKILTVFEDRQDAALWLVKELEKYRKKEGAILAVARGGVAIGFLIAKELGLPLEIILSKKIRHPHNPEFAIGSVSLDNENINLFVDDVPKDFFQNELKRTHEMLREKYALYMNNRKPADLEDKIVIIVDDGAETGITILTSVETIKKSNPRKISIAIPVAPAETVQRLSKIADEFTCLLVPENFLGIDQFYEDLPEVTDEEIVRYLNEANK